MYDCLIIGAGPAGLTAATYLGRFFRRAIVVDAGRSRVLRIPKARNVPGFPDGIAGPDLLARMRAQAEQYGATFVSGVVRNVVVTTGGFIADVGPTQVQAKTALLATGVEVTDPELPSIEEAIARGVLRYCPVCDGFEAAGKNIAVLGGRPGSIEEAKFLRTFSDRVTFVPASDEFVPDAHEIEVARRAGISLAPGSPSHLALTEAGVTMPFPAGASHTFDTLYPCLGAKPRSELASLLGADVSTGGGVLTDRHQMTRTEGLYAAGDVVEGLDQIASACGQAAIAATAIHNRLRHQ